MQGQAPGAADQNVEEALAEGKSESEGPIGAGAPEAGGPVHSHEVLPIGPASCCRPLVLGAVREISGGTSGFFFKAPCSVFTKLVLVQSVQQ